MIEVLISALIIGLLGAGHCLGMCGGISAALAFAIPDASPVKKLFLLLSYNLGRIFSYACIGALAGGIGAWSAQASNVAGVPLLRVLAALMLVLTGFYIAGWWRILAKLERVGNILWLKIQPIANTLMPVKSIPTAAFLGALWGWLPCGLVYSALVLALAQGSVVNGALFMLVFGVGTLPAVLLGGLAANQLKHILKHQSVRNFSGILLIVFGVWTAYSAILHSQHHHGESVNHSEKHGAHHHH